MLAPTLVKPAPLMMPLKIPEPAPPMELVVFKLMALLKVALVPVKVSAPALPIPVPFSVIVFVLPKVPLLKLISKAAPLAIVMLLELLSALLAVKLKVPALTVVAPLYKFAPDKINVPLPVFVNAPVVLVLAPVNVKLFEV